MTLNMINLLGNISILFLKIDHVPKQIYHVCVIPNFPIEFSQKRFQYCLMCLEICLEMFHIRCFQISATIWARPSSGYGSGKLL